MGHFHVLISWMLPWGMYPILLFSFLPKIVFLIFSSQVRRLSLRATCGTFGSRKYFGPCYFCPVRWLGEHPRTAHALVVAGFINRCRPCTRGSFRQNALLGSTLNVLAESTLVVCFTENSFQRFQARQWQSAKCLTYCLWNSLRNNWLTQDFGNNYTAKYRKFVEAKTSMLTQRKVRTCGQ